MEEVDAYFEQLRKRTLQQRHQMQQMAPLVQPEGIQTPLLPHQIAGLQWLLRRESSNALPPLWKRMCYRSFLTARAPFWGRRSRTFYRNVITGQTKGKRPKPVRGGMLAHGFGLGKTLTLISLIVQDKRRGRRNLVVCPTAAAIPCWDSEITRHCHAGCISTLVYKGSKDRLDYDYDVVIMSIDTLAKLPSDHLIWRTNWRRLIVDECQVIGQSLHYYTALEKLLRSRLWLVSSSPVGVRSHGIDMAIYLGLLRIYSSPFNNDLSEYQRVFISERGVRWMQTLNSLLCLKHKEDVKPEAPRYLVHVELLPEDRELYNRLQATATRVANGLNRDHERMLDSNELARCYKWMQMVCFSGMLASLQLTQIADRPPRSNFERATLQELADIGDEFTCPICAELTPTTKMVIPDCLHYCCKACYFINREIYGRIPCANCKVDTKAEVFCLREPPIATEEIPEKIQCIINLVGGHEETKTVVFSQFNNVLDTLHCYLEECLEGTEEKTLRLMGSETTEEKNNLLRRFNSNNGPNILLAPMIMDLGEKLDLTIASQVYLLDSPANPAEEERAISQICHIGQQEEVTVTNIIAKGTLEMNILELQTYYQRLMSIDFEGDEKGLEGLPNNEIYTFIPRL